MKYTIYYREPFDKEWKKDISVESMEQAELYISKDKEVYDDRYEYMINETSERTIYIVQYRRLSSNLDWSTHNSIFETRDSARRSVRGQKARYKDTYEYRILEYSNPIEHDPATF